LWADPGNVALIFLEKGGGFGGALPCSNQTSLYYFVTNHLPAEQALEKI